jgi:thiol-disulfide isomerase/thioredoxin
MTLKKIAAGVLIAFLGACSQPTNKPVLKTFSGKAIDFNDLGKHTVIVNYWADWCEPCKKEIPALNELSRLHKEVWILGVNFDGVDRKHQSLLIQKNKIHYFSLPTDPSLALGIGDIPAVPVSFIFDSKGKLKEKLYGPQTVASLEKAIS